MNSRWHIVKEKLDSIGFLDEAILSLTIDLKESLSFENVTDGLTKLSEKNPEFTGAEYDQDEKKFSLTNNHDNSSERVSIQIVKFNQILLSLGATKISEFEEYINVLLDFVNNILKVNLISINLVGVQLFVFFDLKMDHYQLINDAFYCNSPLYTLFNNNRLIDNDISIRANQDNLTTVVTINSKQAPKEIIEKNYRNNNFQTACGVGYTKGFTFNSNLNETINNQLRVFENYLSDNFFPKVLNPIIKTAEKNLKNDLS